MTVATHSVESSSCFLLCDGETFDAEFEGMALAAATSSCDAETVEAEEIDASAGVERAEMALAAATSLKSARCSTVCAGATTNVAASCRLAVEEDRCSAKGNQRMKGEGRFF